MPNLRKTTIYPITVRELEVLAVTDVTPGMRRVTLGGPGLDAHTAPNGMPVAEFRSDGFDDEFKLFLTHPERTEPLFPDQGDGYVIWPRDPHLVSRTYTVRRWDAEARRIDVDFVVHGMGAATTWARRAQVGDRMPVAGPKMSGAAAVDVDWVLIAGDETALPAIGRWLEEWPAGQRAQVFVEIADDAHRQDLDVPDGVDLTWLSRHGAEPGTTSVMFDALQAAPWWDGSVFAWVAGEATTLVPIRRWLKNEKGLAKDEIEVTGYWRRTEAAVSSDDPELPAEFDDEDDALAERLEIVPGLVVRAALTAGVISALADGARSAREVADEVGGDADTVASLLQYLGFIDVVQEAESGAVQGAESGAVQGVESGAAQGVARGLASGARADAGSGASAACEKRYALTHAAMGLLDDYVGDALDLTGAHAADELVGALALLGLLAPARALGDLGGLGTSAHLGAPSVIASRLDAAEGMAGFYSATLAEMLPLAPARRAVVAGLAARVVADNLVAAHENLDVTIVAPPSHLEVMQARGVRDGVAVAPGSMLSWDGRGDAPGAQTEFDVVLLVDELHQYADADARHLLAQAARQAPAVYVFEEPLDADDMGEHEAEEALIAHALGRGGARTEDEMRALIERAGLVVQERSIVGWGGTLWQLTTADV